MPRNGSGVYSLPYNWNTDRTNSVLITASRVQGQDQDQADAITGSIAADGQTAITANLPMSGFKHTNVARGTVRTSGSAQYADVESVQDGAYRFAVAGGSGDGLTLTLSPAIPGYTAGQVFWARLTAANTLTAPTLAVSGLAAKTIKRLGNGALVAGDLASGAMAGFAYNSNTDCFELVSPPAASTGTGATVRATSPTLVTPTLGVATATSITFGGGVLSEYVAPTAFTPGVAFGGGTTGITYAAQAGRYERIGKTVFFALDVELSNKGSSTGSATVTGLPIAAVNQDAGAAPVGGIRANSINLDTAGGYYTINALTIANATTLSLVESGDNVAAAAITDADFGNASTMRIRGFYEVA